MIVGNILYQNWFITIRDGFAVIGGLWVIYQIFQKIISPRLTKSKLKKLYLLIEDWLDEIEVNLDKGIDIEILGLKEKKIEEFIRDNFKYYKLKFSKRFRKKFLKDCGIKKELRTSKEIFERYSRCPSDMMYLDHYWIQLWKNFYEFHGNYKNQNGEINFANVTMQLRVLKLYLGIKKK
jgi:hypothetical protein